MNYWTLEGISQPLSVLCLGTALYGSAFDTNQSFELLDAFAEAGGNFADTAHVYADWQTGGHGASETTLGAWLRTRGIREQFRVATKGGHPKLETMAESRLRPEDLASDLTESLERLGTDYVDLYWLHRDDPAIPVGEIISVLNGFQQEGRIRVFGASNWSCERLQAASDYAEAHDLSGFAASQLGWSLAVPSTSVGAWYDMRFLDPSALTWHCRAGLPLIPFSAQAGGYFAETSNPNDPKYSLYDNAISRGRRQRTWEMAAVRGIPSNAVALAYLLTHPCGGKAVIGPRTLAQLQESLIALTVELNADARLFLESVPHLPP